MTFLDLIVVLVRYGARMKLIGCCFRGERLGRFLLENPGFWRKRSTPPHKKYWLSWTLLCSPSTPLALGSSKSGPGNPNIVDSFVIEYSVNHSLLKKKVCKSDKKTATTSKKELWLPLLLVFPLTYTHQRACRSPAAIHGHTAPCFLPV